MYKHPNPMDPWDPLKRWYAALWPLERAAVWLCAASFIIAVLGWITM